MFRLLVRFLGFVLRPIFPLLDRIDPSANLERILGVLDRKGEGMEGKFLAGPNAPPRQSFRAHIRFHEASFSQMTFDRFDQMKAVMPTLIRGMFKGSGYYTERFAPTKDEVTPETLAELEALARSMGAKDIAYVPQVPDRLVFQDKGIPHPHAIVFTVEMDQEQMATSPAFESFIEVAKGYRNLGSISNAMTEFLRERGFAAYPGTSLGGLTDYVAMGELAGLGAIGYHGLLIAPGAGARVRINTIYTNITNLPARENAHTWVRDFCSSCRKCVRSCPTDAILLRPESRAGGKVCIDYESCLKYFSSHWGCAVCLAVCPFSNAGYEAIQVGFDRAHPEHEGADVLTFEPPAVPALPKAPRRVAVVGAGPAGFYVTRALLERDENVVVDLLDRLPTPGGLVRYGVAPDHPAVKSKAWAFERILDEARVRFFGNVSFGTDVTREELLDRYDAVVYSVGAASARSLGVPGEELPGSLAAQEFVAWYNGHPEFAKAAHALSGTSAAVVGLGNVALDVTRILLKDRDELDTTDITRDAVEAVRASTISDVHIIRRRGPSQAGFTPKELAELAELPGVQLVVKPEDLERDTPGARGEAARRRAERNVAIFAAHASPPDPAARARVHLHFFRSPVEVQGEHTVQSLVLDAMELQEDEGRLRPHPTGHQETIVASLLVRSVGYRSVRLPDVPFDEDRGVIPSEGGRVLHGDGNPTREYVSGWVRRGPAGVIGTNKVDAEEVVDALLADLEGSPRTEEPPLLPDLLARRGVRVVTKADWRTLRHEEIRAGARADRAAIKFTSVDAMLAFLDERTRREAS